MRHNTDLEQFQNIINYHFKDTGLLKRALTHSSYANELRINRYGDNERLEFLGDAVLELISSEYLFNKHDDINEGGLTKLRASMVCEPSLAFSARQIKLEEYIMLGKGEDATGGRGRDSIVSDAMEALIGAIYLDGGLDSSRTFVLNYILNDMNSKELFFDSKTVLQEMLQSHNAVPKYRIVAETGPEHCKTFEAQVSVNGRVIGTGSGHNKKAAEQKAAYSAVCGLKG